MAEVTIRLEEQEAAELHLLATEILKHWTDEQGPHVDLVTLLRRRLESGLRAHGWAPTGADRWMQRIGRPTGRRR